MVVMFRFVEERRQESLRRRQREALLLIDQLERAHLYLTSALGLETDDGRLSDEVAAVHRDLTDLIRTARRLRVV